VTLRTRGRNLRPSSRATFPAPLKRPLNIVRVNGAAARAHPPPPPPPPRDPRLATPTNIFERYLKLEDRLLTTPRLLLGHCEHEAPAGTRSSPQVATRAGPPNSKPFPARDSYGPSAVHVIVLHLARVSHFLILSCSPNAELALKATGRPFPTSFQPWSHFKLGGLQRSRPPFFTSFVEESSRAPLPAQ
jgi:hypothetical protein